MSDIIMASDFVKKLQALIEDRGDQPLVFTAKDYNGNVASLEFSFQKDDKFYEGQFTNNGFRFPMRMPPQNRIRSERINEKQKREGF